MNDRRAHGVTPALSRDYARRTAERQAAFALPYLQRRMRLLDVGCGPGTVTVGLAKHVAPGEVIGIDHDAVHIEMARALATNEGLTNVRFETGDALHLPFGDHSFDAAFENDLFVHLAADAVSAAREIWRVLAPGGLIAARDVDAEAVVWGAQTDGMRDFDRWFSAWQRRRGSDIGIGRRLPEILHEAGFVATVTSVSADTKGTPDAVREHAGMMVSLLEGPLGEFAVAAGMTDGPGLLRVRDDVRRWGDDPNAFFGNVHVEVAARKPAGARDVRRDDLRQLT
jgi:SAM-dependent methyltransferase